MAKNLFLVNSSINLLSTFVLANSMFEEDENYLALVHPHGYDRWQEDPILRFMSSQEAGFAKVFPLIDRVFSNHLDYIKKNIKTIKFDNVFCGNDCGVQNQLLMSALGVKKFYRLDDGTGSYYSASQRRSFLKVLLHKIKICLIAIYDGVYSDLSINTYAMGEHKDAIGDFLLMPDLLQRYSPKTFEITANMVIKAFEKLKRYGLLKQELNDFKYIIYLSEPINDKPEYNFSFEEEIEVLTNICNQNVDNVRLIYKPHPNDKDYKVKYIKQNLPKIIVNESKVPVEFILYKENNIVEVVSYCCSTLIFAKKITGRNIVCTSLVKRYGCKISENYIKMLEKSGCRFLF